MKQRNIAIHCNGDVVYSETLNGANKAKRPQYIRELMDVATKLLRPGTACILHYQQAGAKGWSSWNYTAGGDTAELIK